MNELEEHITSICEEKGMKINPEALKQITMLIIEYTKELTLQGLQIERYNKPVGFRTLKLEEVHKIEPYTIEILQKPPYHKNIIKNVRKTYFQKTEVIA